MTIKEQTEKGEKGKSELINLNVHEVSIVGKTAIGRPFLTIKSAEDNYTVIMGLQKAIDGDVDAINYFLKSFIPKATDEQMLALGYVKSEAPVEEGTPAKVAKSEETPEVPEVPETNENIDSVMKGIGELKEMFQDLSVRMQDSEETINKMKNVTKGIGDGNHIPEDKNKVVKSTSDEITMGKIK